jgi:nucleotide-binding universal stress UspA family protein
MTESPRKALRRILAASDLTEDSDRGLQAAAALARAVGADLFVHHCVTQPVFPYWEGLVNEETRSRWIDGARMDLEWQVRRVLGDEFTPAALQVVVGEPARSITEHVREVGADLLVLGPHQPRAAFDDLIGTTADRLIRTTSIPCLVANRPVQPPLRRVLIPVDFSGPSDHAVASAMELLGSAVFSRGEEGPETVIEVMFVCAFAASYPRPLAVEPRLSEQVSGALARLPPDHRVRILPRIQNAAVPVDGIRRAAERMDAELIVIGTHGYGTLGRALIGSVASAVVRTIPYPVMIVPPPDNASGR